LAAQTHRAAAGSVHRAADDDLQLAGDAKAEFKTALAPADIIVLMAITFLRKGVCAVPRNRYGSGDERAASSAR
jgi:hypothetical protein